ncbi:uncharacterized protein LOC118430328 isoform X45 [Branchiostoma floridae]|uniref:Uncharacterized protein LOC118430328 isoform X45 n=1 Tax=Branchiostoma floridae TaxID=7739 RepID=A0A9J7M9Y3_BRAFL|nr:uncharacterized protein LOC118430328 isoform X45 [Branchiostoma floridae]
MRQKQAPLRIEDDIESEDITMAAAATEDFHRESGDGLCGDFSCPHCAFSVDQDVMLKVLKHFFNCTSLQYIIDLSVGNAASLGAAKHSAPRRASKAPQPHSEPVRHAEPPTKRRATEARATPPQESPRIVTTQAPTLLARLNAAQSRTQTVSQREIPPEPEHHTRPRQVETVQPRAPETTTTTTTSAASVELPSITTIKEEPGAGAACIVEPTAPTLFDDPMHTQKDTDSAMGMKRDTDNVGSMLDALPGTSSSGLFSEDLNFGGAGPSFVQSDPSQEDSTSGNATDENLQGARGSQHGSCDQVLEEWQSETDFRTYAYYKLDNTNRKLDQTQSYIQPISLGLGVQNPSSDGTPSQLTPPAVPPSPRFKTYNKPTHDTILIGDPTSSKTYPVNVTDYMISLAKATSGRVFLLKMMHLVYSDQELRESNFHGGSVFSKGVKTYKQPLSKDKMNAIIYQTKMEFEGFEVLQGEVDAINGKCRQKRSTFKK